MASGGYKKAQCRKLKKNQGVKPPAATVQAVATVNQFHSSDGRDDSFWMFAERASSGRNVRVLVDSGADIHVCPMSFASATLIGTNQGWHGLCKIVESWSQCDVGRCEKSLSGWTPKLTQRLKEFAMLTQDLLHQWWMGYLSRQAQARPRLALRQLVGHQLSTWTVLHQLMICEQALLDPRRRDLEKCNWPKRTKDLEGTRRTDRI